MLRSKNTLKPIIISDSINPLKSSKNPSLIKHFISQLKSDKLKKKNPNIDELNNYIKEPSLLIIIGDFLGDFDFKTLSKKHEVFVIIIRDSFEESPHILGDKNFIDLPSGKNHNFFFGKRELEEWKRGYEENDKTLIAHLNSLGVGYLKISN